MTFIAFEGGEGSGKSTQSARLAARLDAVLTREPGGTELGERLRTLLLSSGLDPDARAETLLMAAARAQHVAEVIRPALLGGRAVVTDRFSGSSLVYQGLGRGLGVAEVAAVDRFATDGLTPDLTVLLRVTEPVAAARRAGRAPDRIESAGDRFHRLVAAGYEEIAASDPRWVVVDADGDVDAVESLVWAAVRSVVPR